MHGCTWLCRALARSATSCFSHSRGTRSHKNPITDHARGQASPLLAMRLGTWHWPAILSWTRRSWQGTEGKQDGGHAAHLRPGRMNPTGRNSGSAAHRRSPLFECAPSKTRSSFGRPAVATACRASARACQRVPLPAQHSRVVSRLRPRSLRTVEDWRSSSRTSKDLERSAQQAKIWPGRCPARGTERFGITLSPANSSKPSSRRNS